MFREEWSRKGQRRIPRVVKEPNPAGPSGTAPAGAARHSKGEVRGPQQACPPVVPVGGHTDTAADAGRGEASADKPRRGNGPRRDASGSEAFRPAKILTR
jgi:hypothetical protein